MMAKEIQAKIIEYEEFIENILKEDLRLANMAVNRLREEKQHWMTAKLNFRMIRTFQEECPGEDMEIELPLAEWESRGVIATAHVTHSNHVNIHIGCGVSLRMELDEADKYADIRIKAISRQIEHYMKLAVQIKVHIKVTLLAINELMTSSKT